MPSRNPKTTSSNDDRLSGREKSREQRIRRPTDKEAQRRQEIDDTDKAKLAKLQRATARKVVHDSNSELDPAEQEQEPAFSSQVVPSKPTETKVKALTQRTSKIPPTSTQVFRNITNERNPSSHHSDGHDPTDQRSDRSREDTFSDRQVTDEVRYARSESREWRGRPRSRSTSPAAASIRGRSPSAGDKRHRSSSVDSVIAETQAQKLSAGSGRPKVADFDDLTQETAKEAIGAYRCMLAARDPYPDAGTSSEWSKESWGYGQENAGTKVALTPVLAKIVTKRGSQFRGELKTKAVPVVTCALKFQTGGNKKILKANRKKAEDLLEGNSFVYEDPVAKTGLYQTFLIQLIANLMWFANKSDEGIKD
ncbi:hypothetical protein MVEN_00499800 [Mycena venus]|uniref:DUF6532 domain-containing protein n=1 Tax=Mycena venus TaxID=2733690 RepID=A0A8H6YWR9_9AGAR|nr:hypothetical protein MVEN_00499800 [Mycena venus]